MRSYRFRIYPSKLQESKLKHHIWLAKNLWNLLLEKTIEKYNAEKKFLSVSEMGELVKGTDLYSQVAQNVFRNLAKSIQSKVRASKRGDKKWGFPRFKSFDRMRSILYPQSGFHLDSKLRVTPFGELSIVQHRILKGTIKTLAIKREATGKWFVIFTVDEEPVSAPRNTGPKVGLDLGLITLATLSDGTKIKNPRQFKRLAPKLAFARRLFSRKKKGSRNRFRQRLKVAAIHEKITNVRSDYLHKQSTSLVSQFSTIAMEDLNIPSMTADSYHARSINDASWGLLTNMLRYKAAGAGCEILFADPRNTSKECSGCGVLVNKELHERIHNCPSCGLSIDRDVNAAINILARATAGIAGSNACGDEARTSSLIQEAPTLPHGRLG
jgi:putative transposase